MAALEVFATVAYPVFEALLVLELLSSEHPVHRQKQVLQSNIVAVKVFSLLNLWAVWTFTRVYTLTDIFNARAFIYTSFAYHRAHLFLKHIVNFFFISKVQCY